MAGSVNITVVNLTDARAVARKSVDNDTFWTFAANEWWRQYKNWVPSITGQLYSNVSIAPKEITHNAPYAHYLYEGKMMVAPNGSAWAKRGEIKHYNGMALKYTGSPVQGPRWDDAAAPTQRPKLEQSLENYLDGKDVTE